LDGPGGMERGRHIFYTVWMGVTWGRGEPQRIFRWQRCPPKTNGWIRPRPSRGRKKSCCLSSLPYPLSFLSAAEKSAVRAQASGCPVAPAAGRRRAAVRPGAGERPSVQASVRPGVRPSELVQSSRRAAVRPGVGFQELVLFYAPLHCATRSGEQMLEVVDRIFWSSAVRRIFWSSSARRLPSHFLLPTLAFTCTPLLQLHYKPVMLR
jgi:hypothetical protein